MTIFARLFGPIARGLVTTPTQRRTGAIVRHVIAGGYGFVACDTTGEQFFIHCTHLNGPMRAGLQIQFSIGHDARGRRRAEHALILGEATVVTR